MEYAEKDSRFKVFHNDKTISAFDNWNLTMGRLVDVNAKYAKYECADDWMFPEYLERMVELMERDEKLGSCFAYRLMDREIDCFGLDIYQGQIFDGREILLRSIRDSLYLYGGLGQALYRMEALKGLDQNLQIINTQNIHCDIELNDNILLNWKVGFVYQVLTYYRKHDGQVWSYALKRNTDINGLERRVFLHLTFFPELEPMYRKLRLDYALFLVKSRWKRDADVLNWHRDHLKDRPITEQEKRSAITRELKAEFKKLNKTFISGFVMIIKLLRFRLYKV